MPRHVLTVEEQIRGIRRALANPKTPPQLRRALRERREALIAKVQRFKKPKRTLPKRAPTLLDWLGL